MTKKILSVDQIRLDGDTQSRSSIDEEVVSDYAEVWTVAAKTKDPFDAIDVYFDGTDYWCADGFHRLLSALRAKRSSIAANIHSGTSRDAFLFAAKCNTLHGKRRTNADKRHLVTRFLADAEWVKKSARWIAEACCVSHQFVLTCRADQVSTVDSITEMTGKDGKVRPASATQGDGAKAMRSHRAKKEQTQATDREGLSETVCEILDTGKINATTEQIKALAEFEEESQEELVESVVAGIQTLDQAIDTGEVPEPTIDAVMKARNSAIESFCRKLLEFFDANCPDDEWLDHMGCKDGARTKVDQACKGLRTGKTTAACPRCQGDGCKSCKSTGRVTRMALEQLG